MWAGFVLSYKKEHNAWKSVRLGPTNRTYIAAGLMCGTQYRFTVHAFNRLGDSPDSHIVEAKTNGSGKNGIRLVTEGGGRMKYGCLEKGGGRMKYGWLAKGGGRMKYGCL